LRVLNEESISISDFKITSNRLAELISLKHDDKINSSAMQQIFNEMLENGKSSAEELAKEMNLIQVSDTGFIEPIIDEVIDQNPDEVKRFREGKKQLIGFFIGKVMQRSKGKANPKQVREIIIDKLN
jgi:aspartyl-tRNA(Asn)/glutamyl-tRNA(Gln) amidotransferase subunit B